MDRILSHRIKLGMVPGIAPAVLKTPKMYSNYPKKELVLEQNQTSTMKIHGKHKKFRAHRGPKRKATDSTAWG